MENSIFMKVEDVAVALGVSKSYARMLRWHWEYPNPMPTKSSRSSIRNCVRKDTSPFPAESTDSIFWKEPAICSQRRRKSNCQSTRTQRPTRGGYVTDTRIGRETGSNLPSEDLPLSGKHRRGNANSRTKAKRTWI